MIGDLGELSFADLIILILLSLVVDFFNNNNIDYLIILIIAGGFGHPTSFSSSFVMPKPEFVTGSLVANYIGGIIFWVVL